jgi:redox-sensitive bicupin YhaK (pirin superfamily)
VTIVYQGEVAHRDSTGAGGTIGPGDVQWMTAASGILHDEFHSAEFTRNGGTLEIVQLWVNLPAKNKMAGPQYQDILNSDIPEIRLPAEAGTVRVIAGDYQGTRGAATTFTPIDLWDVRLNAGHSVNFEFREGRAVAMVVLHGSVSVEGDAVNEGQWVLLGETGQDVSVGVTKQTTLLLLSGERIDEPIAGYGPFVMNTAQEIKQAILDFNEGKFGHLQGHTPSMR